jgi:hypothetical protein
LHYTVFIFTACTEPKHQSLAFAQGAQEVVGAFVDDRDLFRRQAVVNHVRLAHFGQVVYGGCAILGRRTSYELFDSLDLLSQFLMVMSWVCSRASSDLYIYLWATVHLV